MLVALLAVGAGTLVVFLLLANRSRAGQRKVDPAQAGDGGARSSDGNGASSSDCADGDAGCDTGGDGGGGDGGGGGE